MKRLMVLLLGFAFLAYATRPVSAGEAPPQDPEGEEGQNPPPDKPKGNPELEKRLEKIKAAIAGKKKKAQYKGVAELLSIDCPGDDKVLQAYVTVLVLAVNKLKGDPRHKCAEKICELGLKHTDAGISDKIKAISNMISRNEGKNADIKVCLIFFDHLLAVQHADAEKIIRGFLDLLKDYEPIFFLLLKYSREGTLQIIGEIANDVKDKNLIKRRLATVFLGIWGNGPPLYRVRIPALLKALKSPATSADALKAIRAICFPDHGKPGHWERWWQRNEKEGLGDLDIIREDFKDAYERQRKKEKKGEGADAIAEWIRNWNSSQFRWALPILFNPLLKPAWNDKDLLARVISALGGIGDASALEPLGKLLDQFRGSQKREKRALLCDVIRNMAKIASNSTPDIHAKTGDRISTFLDNLFEEVVEAACEAMGILKYAAAREKLVSIMTANTKPRAALKAAEALGKMQAKEALDDMLAILGKSLEEEDYAKTNLAYHIVKALRLMNVRSPQVVNQLINAIGCPDERVALEALAVLGPEWREPQAVQPIKLFFEDEERNLAARVKALKAIAAYPPELAAEVLFLALRKPSQKTTDKWREALRKGDDDAAKKLGDKVGSGQRFHAIAATYFKQPGRILPAHLSELIAVAKEENNNKEARALCVTWMGRPVVWNEEKCLDYLVIFLDAREYPVVEATREVLKKHRTKTAMEAIMRSLPSRGSRPSWQEMQKVDIIRDYIFNSNKFNYEDPPRTPDFGYQGKDWLNWWRKTRASFKFHEEKAKKEDK